MQKSGDQRRSTAAASGLPLDIGEGGPKDGARRKPLSEERGVTDRRRTPHTLTGRPWQQPHTLTEACGGEAVQSSRQAKRESRWIPVSQLALPLECIRRNSALLRAAGIRANVAQLVRASTGSSHPSNLNDSDLARERERERAAREGKREASRLSESGKSAERERASGRARER